MMTSTVSQSMSFDGNNNQTTFDYQNDITSTYDYQINITEEVVLNNLSIQNGNNSCYPNCLTSVKPSSGNVDFIIGFTCFSFVFLFVIITGFVVFFRHHQQSQKQQKKEKEYLQDKKICAHPFEEILILGTDSQSVELVEMRPITPAN